MSENAEFKTGDIVLGHLKFSEYVIVPKGQGLQKVDASQAPPSYYLGVLGECCLLVCFSSSTVGFSRSQYVIYATYIMLSAIAHSQPHLCRTHP